jgi:DNA-binding NarL/FixJ family response regulator
MTCKTSQCSTIFAVLVEPEHVDPGVVMLTRPDLVTVQHDVVALGQGALDLIAPSITARLSQPSRTHASGRRELNPSNGSSVASEEVLIKPARGRTNSEIADDLHISLSTVKTHLASLMTKLGARNPGEIAIGPTKQTESKTDPKQ